MDETTETKQTVTVDRDALAWVLKALLGPPHYIRELQVTMGGMFGDNPIDLLIQQFREQTPEMAEEKKGDH